MKRQRRLFLIAFCAVAAFLPAGAAAKPVIVVGVPKAPPALPLLRMIESGALADRATLEIAVWSTPEQLIAMTQDGRHRMFVLPLAVAARLVNKGVDIKLTNVSAWGVPSLVTADPGVGAWADLRGKTLFVPPRSSTPDALTGYFLDQAGMKPGRDLEIVHTTAAEIAQLLKAGRIDNGILLEPFVTAVVGDNPRLRVAFDYQEEWRRLKGADAMIPNAGLGAGAAFLAADRDLVLAFEREYEKAVDWVHANPEPAGALAEKYLGLRAAVIARAVPRLGLVYRSAAGAEGAVNDLYRLLFDFSPELIGKRIPDETLFWR